jgi:FixJ family two-component response regulator
MNGTVPFIAIVDDEEPIRSALKRLLRAAGLDAESYASAQAFLRDAATRPPDCVLLDLHMPGTTGQEFLAQVREMERQPPVVIITGHETPETREQCLAAGASAYLHKPIDSRLLLNAISAALRTPAAQGRR